MATPSSPERRREKTELISGFIVLGLGITLLLASFVIAAGFVANPGAFLRSQIQDTTGNQTKAPRASFTFTVNGFSVDFQSNSQQGDAPINSYDWDFGDGSRANGPNAQHTYSGNFSGFVRLTVRDGNGKENAAVGSVQAGPGANLRGNSMADPGDILASFDLSQVFGPIVGVLSGIVIALLVFAGLFTMWLAGASITKAGWNLIKPKPEMIRVRVKPKNLEVEPVYPQAAAPAYAAPAQAYSPPPENMGVPPPPPG
ncbi:MAG: hypothetical protein A3K65_02570 [Euryarchaeota archaeon RBG_16_68_12]|nr:MAG: hypothetical protein A3K65_02570 [Euryarchaeota archaeon RBG_16_68_12]